MPVEPDHPHVHTQVPAVSPEHQDNPEPSPSSIDSQTDDLLPSATVASIASIGPLSPVPKLNLSHAHAAAWLNSAGLFDDDAVTALVKAAGAASVTVKQLLRNQLPAEIQDTTGTPFAFASFVTRTSGMRLEGSTLHKLFLAAITE